MIKNNPRTATAQLPLLPTHAQTAHSKDIRGFMDGMESPRLLAVNAASQENGDLIREWIRGIRFAG